MRSTWSTRRSASPRWRDAVEVIDGYAHCGLSKYEPLERVSEVMDAAGVSRAVLVQHLGEFDNSYLSAVGSADSRRFAAVCLVDHQCDNCIQTVRQLAQACGFRGIRLSTDALAARPDLAYAAVEAGLIIVLYAPRGIAPAAGQLADLLGRHPAARLVVSHLGHPKPAGSPHFTKPADLLRLAEHPNVYVQLSGMKLFCPWPHEPLYPLIDQVMQHFGRDRVYWGSNFPVVGGPTEYLDDLSLLLAGKLPISAADVPAVAGGTARRLWFANDAE